MLSYISYLYKLLVIFLLIFCVSLSFAEDVAVDIADDVAVDIIDNIVDDDIIDDISEDISEDIAEDIEVDIVDDVAEDIIDDISEDIAGDIVVDDIVADDVVDIVEDIVVADIVDDFSLRDAFVVAHGSNSDLLSERYDVFRESELLQQTYGVAFPDIGIALSGSHNVTATDNGAVLDRYSDDSYGSYSASLNIEQSIFAGGALYSAQRAASSGLRAALQDLYAKEQDVFTEVLAAYLEYLRVQQVLLLLRQNRSRLVSHLESIHQGFELGTLKRIDIAFAESELASAEAEIQKALGDLEASIAEYNRSLGDDSSPLPIDFPILPLGNFSEADLLPLALQYNPRVVAERFRLEQAEHNIGVREANFWPKVTGLLSLRHEDSGSAISADSRQSLSIEARVSYPLYKGGTIASGVRQARYERSFRRGRLTSQQLRTKQRLIAAIARYRAASDKSGALEVAVGSAHLARQGAQSEFSRGKRTIQDLLDAERRLLQAQLNATDVRVDLISAHYQIDAGVGRLTAGSLGIGDSFEAVDLRLRNNRNPYRAIRKAEDEL